MTYTEFVNRTKVDVKGYEFDAIHTVYMASDLDKDEFCKMWCKMNASRVERAKEQAKKEAKNQKIRAKADRILFKIEKQMDEYNQDGKIWKSAVLTGKEKMFLLNSNLATESAFDCDAGTLHFIVVTNLKANY